jgi:hypothetical protein
MLKERKKERKRLKRRRAVEMLFKPKKARKKCLLC